MRHRHRPRAGYRTIAGPVSMLVERGGVRSAVIPLTASDGTEQVRDYAASLYDSIRRLVAFELWHGHRLRMAAMRRAASH